MKTQKQKYYWKVVAKHGEYRRGEYYCSAVVDNSTLCLHYELGFPTSPVAGKIFIFRTRQDARNFRISNRQKILKVIAKNVTEAPFRIPDVCISDQFMVDWWNGKCLSFGDGQNTPPGTLFAEEITPIEEIR